MSKFRAYNTGGQLGAAIGSGATSFIPGVGPALAPVGGAIGGAIGGMFSKPKERRVQTRGYLNQGYRDGGSLKPNRPRRTSEVRASRPVRTGEAPAKRPQRTGDNRAARPARRLPAYPYGGAMTTAAQPIGPDAVRYDGPQHEQGGIPIDAQGMPNEQAPIAEVEGGETRQGDYIFSDELIVPETEMTFAEMHEMLLEQGAPEEQIEQLAQMQEQVKQEQGIESPSPQTQDWGTEGYFQDGGNLHPYKNETPEERRVRFQERRAVDAVESTINRNYEQFGKGRLPSKFQRTWHNASSMIFGKPTIDEFNHAVGARRGSYSHISPTGSRYYTPDQYMNNLSSTREASSQKLNNLSKNLEQANVEGLRQFMPQRGIKTKQPMAKGGKLPKYPMGGTAATMAANMTEDDWSEATPTEQSEGRDWGQIAQRFAPSLSRLATAAFAPKPERTRQMTSPDIEPERGVFRDARRRMSGAFRANPNQGSFARYTDAVNQSTAQEAQYTSQIKDRNRQSQMRADQFNIQTEARDADARAQDTAMRIGLVDQAIQAPLTAAQADKRGRQQMIANVMSSLDRVTDPTDWVNRAKTQLRAIGLSDAEIEQIIGDYQSNIPEQKYGGKLKKFKKIG